MENKQIKAWMTLLGALSAIWFLTMSVSVIAYLLTESDKVEMIATIVMIFDAVFFIVLAIVWGEVIGMIREQ